MLIERSRCARTNLVGLIEMGLVVVGKEMAARCNQNQSNSLSDAANSIGDMLTMQMPLVKAKLIPQSCRATLS